MKTLVRQLRRWRFREQLVTLSWGSARWFAIVACLLAAACVADYLYDRYSDSQFVRETLGSYLYRSADRLGMIGETPLGLRVMGTGLQVFVAVSLGSMLIVGPWLRTPRLDRYAFRAETAITEFDHRLVTALQLNRPGARTDGMSRALIAEVTREAGELAARHNLLRLVSYRPVGWAVMLFTPIAAVLAITVAVAPETSIALLKRQALLGGEIPHSIQLENVTQEVWPDGSEVVVRYRVTGPIKPSRTGIVRVKPEGQPTDDYSLRFEKEIDEGAAYFSVTLPPSSIPFTFTARLGDGRSPVPGSVTFEPPPVVKNVETWEILPEYLGKRSNGSRFERQNDGSKNGEVINALPGSTIRVFATFNKPVVSARLIPIDRGDGIKEVLGQPIEPSERDGLDAVWRVPTTARSIGYRIDLMDARGFVSPVAFRRGIRILPDEPPKVTLLPEYIRDPSPTGPEAKGDWEEYRHELPLSPQGRVIVAYQAQSPMGIRAVNLRYRVTGRGQEAEDGAKGTLHPRDDPNATTFLRLPLSAHPDVHDPAKLGAFVPRLGLFEKSGDNGQVEFYPFPSPRPDEVPAGLAASGRYLFEVSGLKKPNPDGKGSSPIAVGDTVEIYVEVYDKNSAPGRPAGYSDGARIKTVVTEAEARRLIIARDEANGRIQQKLRSIEEQQREIFGKPK